MTLTETIYRRKSFRSYSDEQLSAAVLQDIENCIKNAKPLSDYNHPKMEGLCEIARV